LNIAGMWNLGRVIRTRDTPRHVRLAAGGPLPESWQAVPTAALRLRWASAVAFAQRVTAEPPPEDAAQALTELAVELDQRGALLPELPTGDRASRLVAAGQRLHVAGVVAHAAGMPAALRQATREEAAATVRSVLDASLTAAELHDAGADTWTRRELNAFLDSARAATAIEPVQEPWNPPEHAEPHGPVVDISVPHHTEERLRRPLTPPVFRPNRATG
jgi:hypothetical protein